MIAITIAPISPIAAARRAAPRANSRSPGSLERSRGESDASWNPTAPVVTNSARKPSNSSSGSGQEMSA